MFRGIAPPNAVAVSNLDFYRRMAGFDTVGLRVFRIAASCAIPVGLFCAWWLYGRIHRAGDRRSEWIFGTIVALASLLLLSWQFPSMMTLLPVLAAATGAMGLWALTREGQPHDRIRPAISCCSLSSLALVLMWKKILNFQLLYYGFVLAIPGVIVYFCALVSWIPDALARRGQDGRLFRAGALGLIGAMTLIMALPTWHKRASYTHWFEAPNARFFMPETKHDFLVRLVSELKTVLHERSTMVVLPEGALLNFILETPNPSPFIVYLPIEATMFGEGEILESYRRTRPDIVVWLNRDMKYYGYRSFGVDYGLSLASALAERYELYKEVGDYENETGEWAARIFTLPSEESNVTASGY